MLGSTVQVTMPDGMADAYLARPDDSGSQPGVLFIIDAFGLRPRIEEMADRIAAQGYVVLAPNVFYRSGRPSTEPLPDLTSPEARKDFFDNLRPMMEALTPERVAEDGGAYLAYLGERARGPFGITGYCMGARLALGIAEAHPEHVAAVGGFHGGRLVSDDPASPHRSLKNIQAELYFGFADQDQSMTREQIDMLEQALDEAGIRHRTEVYDGAIHGYTMSDTPAYDETASERHFSALFALLERTLQRPRATQA